MRKFLVSGVLGIYMLSVVAFTVIFTGDMKASATDLGVLCINAAYPAAAIQYADSRDNEEPVEESKSEETKDEKTEDAGEPKEPGFRR